MNAVVEPRTSAQASSTTPVLEISDLHTWYGESHILHGVNLAAVAGNGRRVVTNLLDALTPIIREGAERSMEEKADKAVQTAKANRAARRAAAKK